MKSVDEQKKKRFVATSLVPTLKNYTFNRAARAGLCNPFRIAHIEDKGRLPHGVAMTSASRLARSAGFPSAFS